MENINDFNVCYWCMNKLEDGKDVCSHCGKSVSDIVSNSRGLEAGTILNNKYLIGNVIGEGGFGITYIAYDTMIDTRIAIKEYFPSDFATRDTTVKDNKDIVALTGECGEKFKKGMEKFVNEAKRLAKFNQEDGIVSVKDFFYENDTAYMVMEYIEGSSLKDILNNSSDGVIPWEQTVSMMIPVIDSLSKVHKQGIIHRDISPDNILVTPDGKVKLIDFGAARYVDQDNNKSLTVMLKHGYAPEEQYETNSEQGPWTDVYSICATMYRMITGQVPTESVERVLESDKLEHISKKEKNMPYNIASAIMKGLSIKAKDRQQSMEELKISLQKPQSKLKEIVVKHWKKVGLVALVASLCFCAYNLGNLFSKDEIVVDNSKKDKDYEASNTTEEKTKKVELPKEKLIKMIEEKSSDPIFKESIDFENHYCDNDGDDNDDYKTVKASSYDDYDGDGVKELFAITAQTSRREGWRSSYNKKNVKIWYADCDGAKMVKLYEESKDVGHIFNVETAKTGNIKHYIVCCHFHLGTGTGFMYQNDACTLYKGNVIYKDNIGTNCGVDNDGNLFCTIGQRPRKDDGCNYKVTYEKKIFFRDGKYYECGNKKITYEQLCMFSNGEEIYKEVMDKLNTGEYIGKTEDPDDEDEDYSNFELKKGDILYCSDGKIYFNFERKILSQYENNGSLTYFYYARVERDGDKLKNLYIPDEYDQCNIIDDYTEEQNLIKESKKNKTDYEERYFYEDFVDPRT